MVARAEESQYLACATRIGDMVCNAARPTPNGSTWWGRGFDLSRLPCELSGMFNGSSGESWFLARLAAETGQERFAQRAHSGLAPAVLLCEKSSRVSEYALTAGVGITGLGSLIFALADAGDCLDDETLRSAASNVLSAPLEHALDEVGFAELYWGLPMLVLGLLRLPRSIRRDVVLGEVLGRLKEARRTEDPESGALLGIGISIGIVGV